jgi:hypothetical protein
MANVRIEPNFTGSKFIAFIDLSPSPKYHIPILGSGRMRKNMKTREV